MKTIYIVCMIALFVTMMIMPAAATTWDVYEGGSIQGAIDAASDGDTVFVHAGTYLLPDSYFSLCLDKPNVTLKGEGADKVLLDGNECSTAIAIGVNHTSQSDANAPGCTIEGFKIVNFTSSGIWINNAPNCIVRNNVIDGMGCMMGSVDIFADNTTFANNVVVNATGAYGSVCLRDSHFSKVVNNTIIGNTGAGILFFSDSGTTANNIITGNNISSNGYGTFLYSAGPGNKIYLNDFINNGVTATTFGSAVPAVIYWNSTEPIEYTYNGSTYTDYLGNYWDGDYTGSDGNGNGLGDTSYLIPDGLGEDYRPLMSGFENYVSEEETAPTPATPFLVSGSVTYTSGSHVFDPAVTVTNLATGEHFTVKTAAGSNYYLTLTDSTHVTAGDTIQINASDGTVSSETDHPVTASDIETGGFVQDMLLEAGDRPDLTVTEKSEDWVSLADATYDVTYTVANIGTVNADASTTSIKIDGAEVATDSVPALQAGENYIGTVGPFTLSGENDSIEVCSDIADVVDEPDELNNCLENVLEFPDMPELTVTEITTPENIFAGVNNVISATVANTGDADSGAFNVSLAAGGSVVDLAAVTNIPAGDSTTVSFDWTPSGTGNHEICTFADCDLEVPEPDETNNELCENVNAVPPNPDLIIAKIALKTPGYANEDNTLEVAVTNAGVLDAGAFTVSLSVDGTPLPDQTVPQLAAGATTELEYIWTPISTGAHTLYAEADTGNVVTELNESNNDFTRTSVIIDYTDWAQFHYDTAHIGTSPCSAPDTNETLWISDDIGAVGSSSPVIADGKVFVNCGDTVKSLDEFTGAYLGDHGPGSSKYGSWASPCYHDGKVWCAMPEGVNGGIMVADGKVFGGDWDGHHYYCHDEETDEELWNITVSGYAAGTPGYSDGMVYLTSWVYTGGHIYCVDPDTGSEIWHQTVPLDVCSSPAIVNGIVYLTTYDFQGDGDIYALNATDGDILWSQTIQRSDSTPAVVDGYVYVCGGCAGYSDVQTYCFNAVTGTPVWATDVSDGIGGWTISVAVADGKVYVGSSAGLMGCKGTYALDATTGDVIWSHPEGGSSPAVADDIVFTIGGGRVYAFRDPLPDLTVTAIGTPVRLRADVINPISATVENIGSENATSFVVTLEAGGSIVDTDTVTSLNAGESTTVEFLWTPSSTDEYTLNVTADANGEVTESDETNNILSQTETVLDTLTSTVNVRIEGKDDTVWCGDVTFSNSTVMTTDGAIHYLNEPTALGALDEADKLGGFGYVLVDYGWGLYVSEVAGEPPIGWDGWVYRVDYVSPSVGAADYTLYGDEDVLWYFGKMWPLVPPLTIELDRTNVMTGQEFVATVTAYNDSTALFDTVEAADVYVDGELYDVTGINGTLTMSLTADIHTVYVDKGTWADYTRSEKVVTMPAGVKFDLKKLNLNSNGILKAFITLPEGYDVADIDVSTVECEGAHVFGDGSVIPGKQALEVKFKIQDLVDVQIGDAVSLSITGELTTGERFEGSNTVEVIKKEKGKK
jgi:outer membrane protein assembly factor BamB/nitrous oxidase accessory protein NosD